MKRSMIFASLSLSACATTGSKPAWIEKGDISGFFAQACAQQDDGTYQQKYFFLGEDNILLNFIYGKGKACEGKPGVIVVSKRPLPKTTWISERGFVWNMQKGGEGYLIVSPGEKARRMLEEAEAGTLRFSEHEKQASIASGIIPVPLAKDLCFFRGTVTENGKGFVLMGEDRSCFASLDDARLAEVNWGPLHIWSETPTQSADLIFKEATEQYRAALGSL